MNPLSLDEGNAKVDELLGEFFDAAKANSDDHKQVALRITMGAGKTTSTLKKLRNFFAANPKTYVEYYLPTHTLIRELITEKANMGENIDVIHMRGRGESDGQEETPCVRYPYVEVLERAGLSVRSNACWRSEEQKCDFFDECAYWKQFRNNPHKDGAIRFLPHAYLKESRNEKTPLPDIVIIDEAFLTAIQENIKIDTETVRSLFRNTERRDLGNLIVECLQEKQPLLKALRDEGVTVEWLNSLDFDDLRPETPFDGNSKIPKAGLDHSGTKKWAFAKALTRVIVDLPGENGGAFC